MDEVVEDKDVRVVVDAKALMFVVGMEMDYIDNEIKSEFVFNNPNSKGTCGCGESFHVWRDSSIKDSRYVIKIKKSKNKLKQIRACGQNYI